MRTPAGTECKFYYEDFNRGREVQECRLIDRNPASESWSADLCRSCPVPAILRANACPNMVLDARVRRRWLFIRQVEISAYCRLVEQQVSEPMVGCGHCHETREHPVVGAS
jgi:hypothetical protein